MSCRLHPTSCPSSTSTHSEVRPQRHERSRPAPIATNRELGGDFLRRTDRSSPKRTAPHPTGYAQKPIIARTTGAEVPLTVLSFAPRATGFAQQQFTPRCFGTSAGSPNHEGPGDPDLSATCYLLLGHRLAGRLALRAGLRTLLAARHVIALHALGGTVLTSLFAQGTHLPGQRSLVFHQGHTRTARLQARQAVLFAVWAITTDETLPACTQALVAGLDATHFERRIQRGLGTDGRSTNGQQAGDQDTT